MERTRQGGIGMAALGKVIRRSVPIFVVFLCTGWLLSGPNPAISAGPPAALVPFAPSNTIPNPFDTAGSPAGLFVTHCALRAAPTPEVLSLDTSGNPTVFATLPGNCVDNHIAIAPAPTFSVLAPGFPTVNASGFTSGFVYVTVFSDGVPAIFGFDSSGSPRGQLAAFPSATCGTLAGLTFDHVGTFGSGGGRGIAVCSTGQVWLLCGPGTAANGNPCAVNSAPRLLATVPISGTDVPEGPDIAPQCVAGITCLPGLAGQILITVGSSSGSGKLFTVSNTGVVTAVVSTSSPESVAFVPHPKCNYAPANTQAGPSPVYFVADATNNTLDFLPLNVFTAGNFGGNPPGGNALVSTEGGKGITLVTTVHGKLTTSTFAASNSALQGSGFVDCSIPFPLTGLIARQDQNINLQSGSGVVTVDILANNGKFNPLTICVGNTTADGSLPCPAPMNQPPTYGLNGGEPSFAGCASKLTSTPSGLGLACKFFKAKLDIPPPSFNGTLIMKLFYIGGGGDGDAEGGG